MERVPSVGRRKGSGPEKSEPSNGGNTMIEGTVRVPTDEGVIKGRSFLPEEGGPHPLVVFYMDAFGLRPALTEMAGRLVEEGYAVLQPDLYWRVEPYEPFDPGSTFSDPDERERIMALIHSVRIDEVARDTLLLVEALGKTVEAETRGEGREGRNVEGERPTLETDRWGCVGYCMGGRVALRIAEELPSRVAAAASIHGGGLVSDDPDSPHRRVSDIEGALYIGVADEDRSCTPEDQQMLREALEDVGVDHEMELYEGARHGFAVPDLPVYDPDAAERHWSRVLALFDAEFRG